MSRRERRSEQRRNQAHARARRKAATPPPSPRKPSALPEPEYPESESNLRILAAAIFAALFRSGPVGLPRAAVFPAMTLLACVGSITGLSGALIFYLAGAHAYLNPVFVFLRPLLAVFCSLLTFAAIVGLLGLRSGDSDQQSRRAALSGSSVLVLLAGSLPWCLTWLQLFAPEWKHAHFYLALPAIFYALLIQMRRLSPYFSSRDLLMSLAPAVTMFPALLYASEFGAAELVRLAGL